MIIVMDYFEIESKGNRSLAVKKMAGTYFLIKKYIKRKKTT
jgi:hypothetical protein